MSELKDKAFDLAVKKHGFHINDGNKEAVYDVVDLVSEQQQQTIQILARNLEEAANAIEHHYGESDESREIKALAAQHLKDK